MARTILNFTEGLNPAQFVKDYLLKNPGYFRTHSDVFCRLVPPRQKSRRDSKHY